MSSLAQHQSPLTPARNPRGDADTADARIYVADDHPLIVESIKSVFQTFDPSTDVTGFTRISDMEAALEGEPPPDLILVDFDMPGLASVKAVAALMARHPGARVAVISGHVDGHLAREAIRCGCAGFVPKSLAPNAVYHAIRLMTRGGRFLPEILVESPWPGLPPAGSPDAAPIVLPGRQKFGLTRREVEVLRSLATGHTNKQIARELGIEEVTVKLHLRRGYAKLKVRNRIEAVRAVFEGALD